MKLITGLIALWLCLATIGCTNPTPQPQTPCDKAREGLRNTVLVLNAVIITTPDHFTPKDINEIQFWINNANTCIDEFCATANPLYAMCIQTAMEHLNFYRGPIKPPLYVPEANDVVVD